MIKMNRKTIETALLGSICLLIGWGSATLLHECCHLAVARSLGLPATLGTLTLTTGSVFVSGDMTAIQAALVAVAGSLGLVIAGVAMVRLSSNPAVRMIGVVFLCRAWVDVIPVCDLDGAIFAGAAGYVIAVIILLAEVLVCGGMIWYALNKHHEQQPGAV